MNDNSMVTAQNKFIDGCWKKFSDYYTPRISDKNIVIYGAGVYGQFLYKALDHIGYSKNIKYFINDYVKNPDELLFDIPVVSYDKITDKNNYIFIIGIQNCHSLINKLEIDSVDYIQADNSQGFYQDNLMNSVYKCIHLDSISDALYKIEYFYNNMLGEEQKIIDLYKEEYSKKIIENRLLFYKTGDVKYIDANKISVNEYFDSNYYSLTNDEVYVDCGAYDGDSILSFIFHVSGKYKKIIGFEPDKISYSKLKTNVSKYNSIELFPYATGKDNKQVRFESNGLLGASLSDSGDIIEMVKLDDVLIDEEVSLIKMDIEGAELETLKGLKDTILKYHPKLAVCIYHKMDDIYDIPTYIHELVPEYRFKVRQHVSSLLDTVLYCEC